MIETIYWQDPRSIERVAAVLQKGQLVIGDSDTVLGLLACTSVKGFEELNKAKGRYEKPYLVLCSSYEQVYDLIHIPSLIQIEKMMEECWPGPLTLIFNAKEEVPSFMKSTQGTIAIRIPRHEYLLGVIEETGPLFSTSANKAGGEIPETFQEVDPELLLAVHTLVRSQSDEVFSVSASTILDCTGDRIKLVRAGAYPLAELEAITGNSILIS